jgi:hypothetical protein
MRPLPGRRSIVLGPFPGGTSEPPAACHLSSSFFYPRNSLRQPTEHDDEGRGRFGTGGVLKQVAAYWVSTLGSCPEEGWYGSQPRLQNLEIILYEFSPVHTARSGQESLAQGSPWVRQKRCLALKGRETRGNAAQGCESILALSSWPPSGLIPVKEIHPG